MDKRAAHTAEHAFIGALQKVLDQTLNVRKVEHKDDNNTAFIIIPHLDIDSVVKAERIVNRLISENRQILIHTYPSLGEAKRNFPTLRANEHRISGEVRVVEIEGHDISACAMEHVSSLNACEFFLVTRLSKSGTEYEVDFVVGDTARDIAITFSARMMKVCEELGANSNTLENTARKIRIGYDKSFKKLKILSREKLENIESVSKDGISVLRGTFLGLADEALLEFASEKILMPNTVVILSNASDSEMAYFIFARNEAINLDCNTMFKEIVGADGRGGGKPHFVTGVIRKEKASQLIDRLTDRLTH